MNASKNTGWIAGTGVVALLMLVATYFVLVAPQRQQAAEVRDQAAAVAQSNRTLEQETAQLKAQFATLDAQRERLAQVRATLPSAADTPALLRQLSSYAASSGVTLTGVTPSAASVYVPGGATADTSGLVQIPLVVTTTGSFAQSELFVKNVQADMTRFFLVENVAVTSGGAGSQSGGVTTTLTGRIFVLGDVSTVATTATGTTTATTTGATPADTSTTVSVS